MTHRRTFLPTTGLALLLTAFALAAPRGVEGQGAPVPPGLLSADTTLVDRVVAVVGDSAITLTEVVEEWQVAQARGQEPTAEAILEQLVNVQLVVQAAARDSTIVVPAEEVSARVEQAVSQVRERFPSDRAYRQALEQQGMTPQEYRDQLESRIRVEQIQQMYMQRHLAEAGAVPVTEAEMREFYEAQRASLQERPELLTLEQIFVEPAASDSAWSRARAEADSLRALIAEGADFAELAREHSDDPASAEEGGDMGWFRRGVMVREFEEAAFGLRDGEVSAPVRSKFGYHVIRVDKRRPGEVKARHILVRPAVSETDDDRARERADEAARLAREGVAIDSLVARFGDDDFPEEIQVARDQLGELPYDAQTALAGVSEGEVLGPLETDIGGQAYQVVVRVREIREAGEFTFEDLRGQIRQRLSQSRKIERIYERLRRSTYVDIRM